MRSGRVEVERGSVSTGAVVVYADWWRAVCRVRETDPSVFMLLVRSGEGVQMW